MTAKQQLAWCYLNAAIAGCQPGASAGHLNKLLARFLELGGYQAGTIDVRNWLTVDEARNGLLKMAERFLEECERAEQRTGVQRDTPDGRVNG